MRISSVELNQIRVPFKGRFQHASADRAHADAVIVVLKSDEGQVGVGEIVPRPYVTDESIEEVLSTTGPGLADRVCGLSLSSREEVVRWCHEELEASGLALFTGFELAILDLAGRAFDFSVGELVGPEPLGALPRGIVIGFEAETERLPKLCAVLRLGGHRHIKVKVGHADDRKRLDLIAAAVEGVPLRLDANGAWSTSEAIRVLKGLADLPIASVEQPVGQRDFEGLKRVRDETGVQIMADESVCSYQDAERLIEMQAVDVFNVRLGKHGGILAAARIVSLAREAGLTFNLGTLVGETAILSRAGELFGRFVPGFACMDGRGQNDFLLEHDLISQPKTVQNADPRLPGLGIEMSELLLRDVTVRHIVRTTTLRPKGPLRHG
jgi:L-Ala-D/L-Glu epimerase / N-acetyl-D-glutamate racemase